MFASIAQSKITGHAGGSANAVQPVEADQRGIILSLPFAISAPQPFDNLNRLPLQNITGLLPGPSFQTILRPPMTGRLLGKEIDHLAFMYAMTYFDRVAIALPANPMIGGTFGRVSDIQLEFSKIAGVEVMPLFPEGYVDSFYSDEKGMAHFGVEALSSFQKGCSIALNRLIARDQGRWEISNGIYGLSFPIGRKSQRGLVMKVFNRLPVVSEVEDPEDFLKWKEKTKASRRDLRIALNSFVADIEVRSGQEIEAEARRIAEICNELVRLSKERFPRVRLLPMKFHYNREKSTSIGQTGGLFGGILGGAVGDPVTGSTVGAAIGALAGISFEGGPTFNSRIIKSSPFASVVDLQYTANSI